MDLKPEREHLLSNVRPQIYTGPPTCSHELNRNTPASGLAENVHCKDERMNEQLSDSIELQTSRKRLVYEEKFHRQNGTTNIQTIMHVIKGNTGPGVLAMPAAVKNAGLWTGTVGIFMIGCIAAYCMQLMVSCSQYHCKRTGAAALDYGLTAEETFRAGPERFRCLAKPAKTIVNLFMFLALMGVASVYVLFVSENIKQVVDMHYPEASYVKLQVYGGALLLIFIPLALAKNLKYLAPFSAVANFLTFACLFIIMGYCLYDMPSYDQYPAFASWDSLMLFFGMAIFAYEGITVVMSIENEAKNPEDFHGFTGGLTLSMTIVTCFYVAVGFYGYIKFGNAICGSVTLNMPLEYWVFQAVRVAYAFVVLVSYSIQIYVPIQLVYAVIKTHIKSKRWQTLVTYSMRILLVLITYTLAATIPHLDLVISLVGSFASTFLSIVFPPMLHIITFLPNKQKYKAELCLHILLCIFGICGFTMGTYVSVNSIINASKGEVKKSGC